MTIRTMIKASILIGALSLALPACAADALTSPATFSQDMKAARAGDRIILTPGVYGDLLVPQADHKVPVTVDARAADIKTLIFRKTAGWVWTGGTIDSRGNAKSTKVVLVDESDRITLSGVTVQNGINGVVVARGSEDIVLKDMTARWLGGDGFVLMGAKKVKLLNNKCLQFRTNDTRHPDCIQMWSPSAENPTEDVDIIGTKAVGNMQGITHFWHEKLGRPPVRRIRLLNNNLTVSNWWGIALQNASGADIRGNTVRTLPGAVFKGHIPKARLRYYGDKVVACGNLVADYPNENSNKPCTTSNMVPVTVSAN